MRTTKPPPLQQLTHDTHVQNGSNNLVRRYVTSCLAISSSLSRRPYAHPAMANDTTHSAPSDITHYQYPARPVGEMIPVPVAGHHSSSSRSSELEFSEHCTWVVDHGGGLVGSTIPHKRQQELCGAAPVSRRGQETSHDRPSGAERIVITGVRPRRLRQIQLRRRSQTGLVGVAQQITAGDLKRRQRRILVLHQRFRLDDGQSLGPNPAPAASWSGTRGAVQYERLAAGQPAAA